MKFFRRIHCIWATKKLKKRLVKLGIDTTPCDELLEHIKELNKRSFLPSWLRQGGKGFS